MSSYGYTYKGYCSQDGEGSYADDWNKTSYSSSDHVCRPVLIDAEGRKRPIISYNAPNNNCDYYVVKTEAIVQSTVDSPLVYDYKQSLPARVEPGRTYGGVADGKWFRPSSPVRCPMEDKLNTLSPVNGFSPKADEYNKPQGVESGFTPLVSNYTSSYPTGVKPLWTNNGGAMEKNGNRPLSPVTYSEPFYGVPQKVDEFNEVQRFPRVEPVRTHGSVAEEKWGRPKPEKFNEFNNTREKWQRPPNPIRQSEPDKVNEFFNNVQTEASRPRSPPLSATYWRQTPQVTTSYGYDGDSGKKVGQSTSDPAMISTGGWSRPSHATWASPPEATGGWSRPSHATWASPPEGSLAKPTNDINTAMAYLLESAKPSSGVIAPHGSPVAMPISTGLSADSYTPTIDSREAARRYGKFNFPNNAKNEAYTTTIDSKEAARKYGGERV